MCTSVGSSCLSLQINMLPELTSIAVWIESLTDEQWPHDHNCSPRSHVKWVCCYGYLNRPPTITPKYYSYTSYLTCFIHAHSKVVPLWEVHVLNRSYLVYGCWPTTPHYFPKLGVRSSNHLPPWFYQWGKFIGFTCALRFTMLICRSINYLTLYCVSGHQNNWT